MAVDDRVLVAVERAHRRARGAIPFGVVLTAVAWTAEAAGREHLDQRDVLTAALVDLLLRVVEHRPVRLHGTAEMRAAVGDDREARLSHQKAVVADVRGAACHLAHRRIEEERREAPFALREVRERAEVGEVLALLPERGRKRHHRHGDGHDRADHTAEPERHALEELAPREPFAGCGLRHPRLALDRGNRRSDLGRLRRPPLRLDVLGNTAVFARRIADPEKGEDDCDRTADRSDELRADDQAAGDPGRKADWVQRRTGNVRLVAAFGLHYAPLPVWVTTMDSTAERIAMSTT